MLNFDYYDKLKEASVVPDRIKELFDIDGSKSNFFLDTILPAVRVGLYAALHEKNLFSIVCEKMPAVEEVLPFFANKLKAEDLFECLCGLGDDCLLFLLQKLDCPDSVLNELYRSVVMNDYRKFETSLLNSTIDTCPIVATCRLLYIEICINRIVEWVCQAGQHLEEIKDEELYEKEEKRNTIIFKTIYVSLFEEVLNNNTDPDLDVLSTLRGDLDKEFDAGYEFGMCEAANADDSTETCFEDCISDLLRRLFPGYDENGSLDLFVDYFYRLLLWLYYYCVKLQMSVAAIEILRDIIFTSAKKPIWSRYEEDKAWDILRIELYDYWERLLRDNSQSATPQISESGSTEAVTGSAFTWHLPPDFFDKNYIDKCEIDEYIPCFLEDKLKFATVTNDKLSELKVRLNDAFEEFIETLAENNCIDNDYVTKASLAHALTGRKVDVETKKVRWKNTQSTKRLGWLSNICHIVRYIYPKYIYDKEHNQLDKYGQMTIVFDLDFDSIPLEERPQRTPKSKLSSSYADNADDFIKDAIVKFINTVLVIKKSVCNME